MSDERDNFTAMLTTFVEALLGRVWTALPGAIVEYDPATRRASVQPTVGDGAAALPVVCNVPVIWPGGNWLSGPLPAGAGVLLVFQSRSLALWLAASHGEQVQPGNSRHHALSDAVAIPGLFGSGGCGEASNDGLLLQFAGKVRVTNGTITLTMDGDVCTIDGAATVKAGGDGDLLLDSFRTLYFDTHTHTSAAPGAPTSTPLNLPSSGATTVTKGA